MAEIATKKSIKVVSSKKCNDACGVKSNNGLIDLGNITSSNNHTQLITLHDDDVTQNMKIETDVTREDNSLQELIDRELALRISSTNDIYDNEMETVDEESQASRSQPEITKIILEPYMNPQDDVNSAFIIAEMNHYTILRDPYTYRNGHSNEDSQLKEDIAPSDATGTVDLHQIKPKIDESCQDDDSFIILEAEQPEPSSAATGDNHLEQYSSKDHFDNNHSHSSARVTESPKTLSDREYFSDEIAQIGQFSDNFDDATLQQQASMPSNLESLDSDGPLSDSMTLRIDEEQVKAGEQSYGIEVDLSSTLDSNGIPHRDEDTASKSRHPCGEVVAKTSSLDKSEEISLENRLTSPLVQLSYDAGQLENQAIGDDAYHSEATRNKEKFERNDEFVRIERDDIRGMIEHVIGEVVQQAEEQVSQKLAEQEEMSNNPANATGNDDLEKPESKDDDDNGVEIIRAVDKTEEMAINEDTSRHVFADEQCRYVDRCFPERRQSPTQDFESWTTVEQATSKITSEQFTEDTIEQFTGTTTVDPNLPLPNLRDDSASVEPQQLAPLATSDDEITDVSNKCDVHIESHDDVVTGSSIVTSSTTSTKTTKTTKTKKKKIEGVTSGDASPGLTPKTKKTKKSKKSDSEKENISVKSSSNKFDALSKKSVLHVRSVDAGKVQQQFNSTGGQNGDANPNCRSCGKVVFQMEQVKAEGLTWHKNCFRCNQCSKQLTVDNYQSHESTLYCKPHFRELFQPKPVEESDQPIRPRKPELIIRENQPTELPPDVVRASDKPDLGLEELASLNVKSRFQVFEKTNTEVNDIDRSPSQVAVKRSPSILSKLAKFQAKGMDIGVADESLNGIPFEESSESEEEEEEDEEVDTEIVKSKRSIRERPMSFSKMDDMKNRWETTSQQGRRESQREARKEEIAGIRSRLFMGKQGKMKELYQQAVADSERITKVNAADEIQEIQQNAHAKSIKARFERGEPINAHDDENSEEKSKHHECPDEEVIAAGISKKSRSIFLELDATAAKTGRPVTPVAPKAPNDIPRRARDAFMGRQVSDDVVRSSDTTEEVRVETTDISNKFKFFETYKAPEKQRRQFRITPPRDGQVKMESPDREIYRDPEVVRADDRVDEVMRTDTARKMLSIFRQMEENATKEDIPDGPKPLKRFTPPPEDKFAKPTASESEDDEEEDGEDSAAEDCAEEHDPNYVRASDKVEDEFLKQSLNAARAKTLRAKFEHWTDETDGKNVHSNVAEMEMAQGAGEQSSIESASSLRARFESLGSQNTEAPRTVKVKVNRFVGIPTTNLEVCEICEKKVYPLEKVETNNKIFHKQCFRCLQCNCILRMDTFTLNNGRLYCIPHFKQLFITRGNYDEGFGINPHKNKWASPTPGSPTMPMATNSPTPITVSNGDV